MKEVLRKELSKLLSIPVHWDCSLKSYTSFHIGGPAEALVQVQSLEELRKLLKFLHQNSIQWRVIGRGTNLLVQDQGFTGVIMILSGDLQSLAIDSKEDIVFLDVGAGHGITKLSAICGASGFSGLEFTMGIPGSVGGAVVMNAGAWGRSIADVLVNVSVMTVEGETTIEEKDLKFDYRRWLNVSNEKSFVVTSVKMRLTRSDFEEVLNLCRYYREKRSAAQPVGVGNAGSIFRNPPDDSAGRLIEASGLKGKAIGGAEVSVKHANFIINNGGATASDVLELMKCIQQKVKNDSGVDLEPEVHIL